MPNHNDSTRQSRRGASKVARSGGLIGVDWIERRLSRSIRKMIMDAERSAQFTLRDVEKADLESVLRPDPPVPWK